MLNTKAYAPIKGPAFYQGDITDPVAIILNRRKGLNQAQVVLELIQSLRQMGKLRVAPSEVCQLLYPYTRWPITSIRRSITVLTHSGLLQKTTLQHKGPYGEPEHLWELPTDKGNN
jgi:hypothetical protein